MRGCPIVIPLALEVQSPCKSQPLQSDKTRIYEKPPVPNRSFITSTYVPPKDILVNGQAQETDCYIQAVYGTGWYNVESLDGFLYRWAQSPAEVYIHCPEQLDIEISFTPVAIYQEGVLEGLGDRGIMHATLNDQTQAKLLLQREYPVATDLVLLNGWNVLRFELEAGNFRPADIDPVNSDQRLLSFALHDLNIVQQ